MRKMLWCCLAAAVAALVGTYAAADYACEHPRSWVGRTFHVARQLAERQWAMYHMGHAAAQHAVRNVTGVMRNPTACCEETACPAHEECFAEAVPHAQVVCVGPDVVEVAPALLPGGIVVGGHEEFGGELGAPPLPPVPDFVGVTPLPGGLEEATMPPVPADEPEPIGMPRVEDEEEDCCRQEKPATAPPTCPETHHGCPYLWNRNHPCPPRTIKGREGHPGTEECEPQMRMPHDPENPRHPEVDTMEFRPSDLGFNRIDLRGPF
jgi:hypothetical protein